MWITISYVNSKQQPTVSLRISRTSFEHFSSLLVRITPKLKLQAPWKPFLPTWLQYQFPVLWRVQETLLYRVLHLPTIQKNHQDEPWSESSSRKTLGTISFIFREKCKNKSSINPLNKILTERNEWEEKLIKYNANFVAKLNVVEGYTDRRVLCSSI